MNVISLSQAQHVGGGNAANLLRAATWLWAHRETLSNIAEAAAVELADLDAECGAR